MKSHIPNRVTTHPRPLIWLSLALFCLAAVPGWAAQPVSPPQRLDSGVGEVSESRVIGSPQRMAVAWVVNEGAGAGIYVRRASNNVWAAPEIIPTPPMQGRRDLQLGMDGTGRLMLAWTAQLGPGRVLYAATQPAPAEPFSLNIIASNADFPALGVDPEGSGLLAWQQGDGFRQSIEALRLLADGTSQPLGRVSADQAGLNPQVLHHAPPLVAWYAVEDLGTPLKVSEFRNGVWGDGQLNATALRFPKNEQILFDLSPTGLAGIWPEQNPPGLGLGVQSVAVNTLGVYPSDTFTSHTLSRPTGDAQQPSLSGNPDGRLTAAWRVFTGESQRICIASVLDSVDRRLLIVSPPGQRFPRQPSHVTTGDWSAVVWTNPAADGGDGGLYLADVNWLAQ